jgi:cell division protein FtsQ
MTPVSTPVDRRFRRAQVTPNRRRWTKRILPPVLKYIALPLVCLFLAGRMWVAVVGASPLRVRQIAVTGNARLPTGQITALLEGLSGEPLLSTDLSQWRERLLASPWVADVHLRRRLPSTVVIRVEERQPIGVARLGTGLYLMDEHGVVLDEYGPQYGDLDLPLVSGLGPVRGNSAADGLRVDLAVRVITSLKSVPMLAKRLSEVNVSDEYDATVILSGDRAVLHVGTDRFVSRLTAYGDMSKALREHVQEIDAVDLRFEDRMFVRPAGRARGAADAAGDARRVNSQATADGTAGGKKP